MALSFAGNGTITGLSVGGLPDGTVDEGTLANNAVASGKLASGVGGKVLQVVQTVKTDVFTTYNASYTTVTGFEVGINPSSTSSKVLVTWSMPISSQTASGSQHIGLFRDGTHIFKGDSSSSRAVVTSSTDSYGAGDKATRLASGQFLDSPASVGTVTYGIRVRRSTSVGSYVNVNRCSLDYDNDDSGRMASSITVMEISA